jgi:hypothetical protein
MSTSSSSWYPVWQLLGRPVQDAISLLEPRGFKVSRIREGNNPSKPELFPEALFATRRGGLVPCVIGDLEWRVIATIDQEKIAKTRTFIFCIVYDTPNP